MPAATWIRALGKRMVKFDFKGYSHEKKWVAIGEGDEDWPEVLKALDDIGYHGWATSEVAGGGEQELRDIAQRMNKVLENLIDRVASLPKEAQEEIVRSVVEIEQRHTGVYRLDEEERRDLLEALAEVERGEIAGDEEAAALFKRLKA